MLCEESITPSITSGSSDPNLNRTKQEIARDIKDAVDKWEDNVTWEMNGVNIVASEDYSLPESQQCSTDPIPEELGRFEVKFVQNGRIRSACRPIQLWGMGPLACWRSDSWEDRGIEMIESGSVLLNESYGAEWNSFDVVSGCTFLHQQTVHEVGHAFGIGNTTGLNFNRHPINTMHSAMSYDDETADYCEPQAYDIVALMAFYQSR